MMETCSDVVKIGTNKERTKYAIQEKLFDEFTGYLVDPSKGEHGEITMVSGSV